jgi:hypothetical protein
MALFSLFAEKLAACSLFPSVSPSGLPAISSLPPMVVHSVQSPATQTRTFVANRYQQGSGQMPWSAELLLSGEIKAAVSCSPSTAGTQPRPPHSLDFLLFEPETDSS